MSRDELDRLGGSFNEMAVRLQSRNAQLRAHADDLERRVAERTIDLVAAKSAIEQSEQSLAITLDSIGDAVIATDTTGLVVRMNPVAQRLTGWTLAEARERPLREVFRIINETTRAEVESPVAIVLERGITVGLANHTALISRDGAERASADSAHRSAIPREPSAASCSCFATRPRSARPSGNCARARLAPRQSWRQRSTRSSSWTSRVESSTSSSARSNVTVRRRTS
jgi:PAS domain S-box-containing protein